MEQVLLPLFQCQVALPTRLDFAMRFSELVGGGESLSPSSPLLNAREKSLVQFLLELSAMDFNLNYFLPSRVAAGAIHLAMQVP